MKAFSIWTLVFGVALLAAPLAMAESTDREGYVKLPTLSSAMPENGVFLMLDAGEVKTVGSQEVKAIEPSKPKFRCNLLPKLNGCL